MSDYEPKCKKTLPIIFDDRMPVNNLTPKLVSRVNNNTEDLKNLCEETETMQGDIENLQEDVDDKLDIPETAGTAGQVLTSDGEGGAVWASVGSGEIVVDPTLTVEGAAADAKKTGDEITHVKQDINELTDKTVDQSNQLINVSTGVTGTVVDGGSVSAEGAWANYKTSDYIPVEAGKTYTFYLIKSDGTQPVAAYRLIYGLYDTSKAFVANSYFNTVNLNKTTITPSLNGFVRVSCGDVSSQQYAFSRMAMLVEGSTLLPYEDYYYDVFVELSNSIHLNDTQNEDATSATIEEIAETVSHQGTETVDLTFTSGYCNKSGEITTPWAEYAFTQLLDVHVGDTVRVYDKTHSEDCNFRYVTAYSSGVAISASGQEGGYSYTVPSGIDQVRITVNARVVDLNNSVMYRHGTIDALQIKRELLPPTGNVLANKKWAVCGDSFTAYTNAYMESGDYVGKMRTYPFLIGDRNQMTILDAFASSGRTLAYPSDGTFTNSLCCPTDAGYYQNIPADVDYITIMLGINDNQHIGSGTTGDGEDATGVITLGTINDATTATYYGAWNVVLGWIRENRPFAHVGIVISNGIEVQEWVEAIENVAKKWGFPTLNLNGDERCPVMIRAYNPNVPAAIKQTIKEKQAVDYNGTTTGSVNTHPNWQTHELESTIFEAWLRSL